MRINLDVTMGRHIEAFFGCVVCCGMGFWRYWISFHKNVVMKDDVVEMRIPKIFLF